MTVFARLCARIFVSVAVCCSAVSVPSVHAQFLDRNALKKSQEQQASQRAAMAKIMAGQGIAMAPDPNSAQAEADLLDNASPAVAAKATPVKLGPKKPGVVRVGIVLPSNQINGANDLNAGEPVRAAQGRLLTGPKVETVNLSAILPTQAMEEAKGLDCDYVLASSLTQQEAAPTRLSKFANMRMVHMATTAAQFIPGVQMTAMMASLLASEVQGLQSLSQSVKANSDVTLAYTLTDKNGNVKLQDSEKVRTKNDAENVLTPMLTSAAGKIVAVAGS